MLDQLDLVRVASAGRAGSFSFCEPAATNFPADPYLFLSTDWAVQHVLISNSALGDRFRYVEPPKSKLTEIMDSQDKPHNKPGESILDVAPTGGTLVVFDSVALPHEVMATMERDRWAISGWFHEAQQEIPRRQQPQTFV